MCRKHLEPYKCEFVPENEIVIFMLHNKQLMEKVYQEYELYRAAFSGDRQVWKGLKKQYHFCDAVKCFKALILLKYNFKDSYIASNDILTRCIRIYKRHRDKIINASLV